MTAALVGTAWAALVLVVARRVAPGPPPRPVRGTRPGPAGPDPAPGPGRAVAEPEPAPGPARAVAELVGAGVLRVARRPAPPAGAARLGWAILAAAGALVVMAPAAPGVGAVVWALPALGERRRRKRRRDLLLRDLPEVADLLVLAVGAGLTVPLAVAAVSRRAPGPLAHELARVIDEVGLGRRLSDALADVPSRAGEEVRPLIAALVASDRYGAPLLDGLVRLSGELRSDRRRRAEEAARRVPVKLLFPLVFCTLPAFALLTVAPLLAGALRALRL
ncbi:MAG: type II secretion system F family protein [Acidimicrobiales bacterium]